MLVKNNKKKGGQIKKIFREKLILGQNVANPKHWLVQKKPRPNMQRKEMEI